MAGKSISTVIRLLGSWLIVLTVLFSSGNVKAQTADTSSAAAKQMISSIWEASQIYYQDKGEWPSKLDTLISSRYLSMPSGTPKGMEVLPKLQRPTFRNSRHVLDPNL